ncbi:MAG: nitrate ABC transporter permease [Paenibacillus sp. RIFOXYA1_FULL_44_5]|nr:MAG: nitrate ABC transporter permease [Paenibacillus sp. RIFOXYA1_FULL_44_5]
MKNTWFHKGWPPVLAVILLFLLWQLSVWWGHFPDWLLPGPFAVLAAFVKIFPRIMMHTMATLQITGIGFVIGAAIGFLLAVLLHLSPALKRALYPLIILSQNIPIIALAPLLIIWFGFGMLPKIIIIVLVCFFPITVAMMDGFMQTDREMLNYMRMSGANPRQIFMKLELPHSLAFLFSGLKISATYSVMGAVISEWLGASAGIGYFMTLSSNSFLTARVFAAIFVIVLISLTFFGLIVMMEKIVIRWKPDEGSIHHDR